MLLGLFKSHLGTQFLCGPVRESCQADPLVSRVLAVVMVQAAFLQSLGHCTRMVSYLPHLDFGCWQGSLGRGLGVSEEASGCSVCSGDLRVQGWRLFGMQAGQFLSNAGRLCFQSTRSSGLSFSE